jgi:hypothetical protein
MCFVPILSPTGLFLVRVEIVPCILLLSPTIGTCHNNSSPRWVQWLTPVILASQEAEIRRIVV